MAKLYAQRMTSELDGDFVVFLIGMRINKPWKPHKWLPVLLAMPRMLKELRSRPECGCLGYTQAGLTVIQYWRSFDDLESYARSRDASHWPAWVDFNRRMKTSRDDVGIWHETYRIAPGAYEAVYSGMPPYGLGRVGKLAPAGAGRESARQRISAR